MIKKTLIPIVLLVTLFGYSSLYCQVPYFYDCYENSKADCGNCGPLEQKQLTIDIEGCPVKVSYLYQECTCPNPRVYFMINYVRINLTTPEACCKLVCKIHPPGPYNMDCGPDHSKNCWNNPTDKDEIGLLHKTLYERLASHIFDSLSTQYTCPTAIELEYYWPARCMSACSYKCFLKKDPRIQVALYFTLPCEPRGCCGYRFKRCIGPDGEPVNIQIEPVGGWVQEGCKGTTSDYCKYNVGDIIDIMGSEFVIIGAQQTDCFTNCDPDYD